MKLKILLFFLLIFMYSSAISQQKTITGEERNMAIDMADSAIRNIQKQNYDAAIPLMVKAISLDSTLRKPYLYLYTLATEKEEFRDSAMMFLQKAKQLFQQDDEICYYVGEVYRMQGDLNRAIMEYSRAIAYSKINGSDFYLVPHYYFNRATILLKKNRFSSAVVDYSYALQLKPEYTQAYINRGISLFQSGKIEDACSDWKSAMELGSDTAKQYWEKNCQGKEVN